MSYRRVALVRPTDAPVCRTVASLWYGPTVATEGSGGPAPHISAAVQRARRARSSLGQAGQVARRHGAAGDGLGVDACGVGADLPPASRTPLRPGAPAKPSCVGAAAWQLAQRASTTAATCSNAGGAAASAVPPPGSARLWPPTRDSSPPRSCPRPQPATARPRAPPGRRSQVEPVADERADHPDADQDRPVPRMGIGHRVVV